MANLPYIVVSDIAMVETTVNKSRFIGVTFPVNNIDQVKEALGSLKKSNKDAKHIPYAYLLGEDFSVARNSDDGVRYFGGVELGKSKLTRVYYSAAVNALNNARKNKMVYCGIFEMKVSYGDYGALGKVLTEKGFPIIEKNFDESMPMIKCAIPADTADRAIDEIRAKMKDSAQMIKVDNTYYRFPHNG